MMTYLNRLFRKWRKPAGRQGQVMLEFAFCMVVLFLMMYGLIMVFRWVGLDLGQRRQAHDELLITDITQDYGECLVYGPFGASCLIWSSDPSAVADGPLKQVDPYFYKPTRMNAVWEGD